MVILFLGMIFFSDAGAYPEVGNRVRYEARYRGEPVTQEKEILFHDAGQDLFWVRTVTRFRGQVLEDREVALPRSFLYTPEKIQSVLRKCTAREGALSVMEVLGRKTKVCEFFNEDSQLTSILGDVPFGLIRFQVYVEEEDFLDFWIKEVDPPARSKHSRAQSFDGS